MGIITILLMLGFVTGLFGKKEAEMFLYRCSAWTFVGVAVLSLVLYVCFGLIV